MRTNLPKVNSKFMKNELVKMLVQLTFLFLCESGIDFKIKTINVQDQRVKLQVWDTAGQERFRTITQTYYKGAMGIVLVYDCTEESTFNNISNWLKQIETHASSGVAKVLVANKTDLPNRVISTERGQALA